MHYFIDTLGSQGLKSFKIQCEVKKLYSYPEKIMLEICDFLSHKAKNKGIKVDFIHNFLNNGIKGIAFPELNKCIVNTLAYEENGVPFALESGYIDCLKELDKAKAHFKNALSVHDEWEKYYIDNFDFSILDGECVRLTYEIFNGKTGNEKGYIFDRFLGAATAFGAVDYVENLTEDINKRYFIKGRPGTGKSTFMKKIINTAKEKNFDVEVYHCAFDPKSIDMLIIRDLSVAVFDSTAPHEHFPSRESDEIIDFYKLAAKRNVDREYREELSSVSLRYKENIGLATECIKRCNDIFKENEKIHLKRIDKKNVICLSEVLAAGVFGC